jgi:hypothetical protein
MQPIPCAHCGNNFMRHNLDPELPRLCNNCEIREEKRNPKEKKMETIDIIITVPCKDHIAIEEYCINHGMDFSKYFLDLYYKEKIFKDEFDKHARNSNVLIGDTPQDSNEEIKEDTRTQKKGHKK